MVARNNFGAPETRKSRFSQNDLSWTTSVPAGSLAAALIGVGAGGEAPTTPYLLTRYFGRRAFSTLYGLTWTFYTAAGAMGPVKLGRAFDTTGSCASLLTLLTTALGLAAATNLLLPRYSDSFAARDSTSNR